MIKIEGHGVYCCVYYIDQEDFYEIANTNLNDVTTDEVQSRFSLVEENCTSKQIISKGFFCNSTKYQFKISGVDEVGQTMIISFDENNLKSASNNFIAPKNNQICVVVYDEFQNGVTTIPISNKALDVEKLLYITKDIPPHESEGGQKDLWEMTTNQSLFAEDSWEDSEGRTQYSDSEFYLDAIQYDDKVFVLDNLSFKDAHSRVWVWKHNDETGGFELDYLTSQKIDWGFRGQAGPVIIKEL